MFHDEQRLLVSDSIKETVSLPEDQLDDTTYVNFLFDPIELTFSAVLVGIKQAPKKITVSALARFDDTIFIMGKSIICNQIKIEKFDKRYEIDMAGYYLKTTKISFSKNEGQLCDCRFVFNKILTE